MSNIDKHALTEMREKFERWWEINFHSSQPPRHGWEFWRDGEGYSIEGDEEFQWRWEAWQAAHSEKLEAAQKLIDEQREIMRQAASDISYAIFNLTGSDLSRLKPGVVETTDPTDTALIAERSLRAAAAGKGE